MVLGIESQVQLSTDNWLTIIGFAVMATIYVVNSRIGNKVLSGKLEVIDATMESFQVEMKKLNEVLVTQAVQNSHIGMLEQRILQEGRRLDNMARSLNHILLKLAMPMLSPSTTIRDNDDLD